MTISSRITIPLATRQFKLSWFWLGLLGFIIEFSSPLTLANDLSTPPATEFRGAAAKNSRGRPTTAWPDHALTLAECLDLALQQSPTLLKARQDVEEAHGISLQHQSVYLPNLGITGAYSRLEEDRIERVSFAPGEPAVAFQNNQNWNVQIQVLQPLFAGGRLRSAARSAKLTREAALAQYQSMISDVLLDIRMAYFDVLLASEQITVQEASIELLTKELQDTVRRYDAGTVPRFNVLRAEVELANGKPRLIRARNALRLSKNNLAALLGLDIPEYSDQDIPLRASDKLQAVDYDIHLAAAIARALDQRPELVALRTGQKLRSEEVRQARSAYYPQLSGVAGYGWQNRNFVRDLSQELQGWNVGAQLSWDVWDFGLTRGRVKAAVAREEKAEIEVDEQYRRVEFEVRQAHSNFIEAREVLDSQLKVTEQGEEALRLAMTRSEAGTGTQLDVLSAQTALTEARTTFSQALRDYSVALAKLARSMGDGVLLEIPETP
jgi:outer membrane protein TolC